MAVDRWRAEIDAMARDSERPRPLHQSRGSGAAMAFRTDGRAMRSERSRLRCRLFDPQHDVCALFHECRKCAVPEVAALSGADVGRWAQRLPRARLSMQARTGKNP